MLYLTYFIILFLTSDFTLMTNNMKHYENANFNFIFKCNREKTHGRYTRDISDFHVVVPRKVHSNGSFQSFVLPHFYSSQLRKKRSLEDQRIYYEIEINDKLYQLELEPNLRFTGPAMVVERRRSLTNLSQVELNQPRKHLCHYTGKIKGMKQSRVALSGCDGLAGYIRTEDSMFYIEPKLGESADMNGEHVHVVYKRSVETENDKDGDANCAVEGLVNWWNSWGSAFAAAREKMTSWYKGSDTGHVVNRYIECLVVADLKFIMHNKNIDIEEYILTIMNMVSDFYHDASIGNMIDVVVVRIIYLEKEKEEIDLVISPDADKTLESFCNWQMHINPKDQSHPNHHDLAILLTRHDICSKSESCGLLGLAYVGSVCTPNKNCAINEDTGLLLGVVVAHEIGHTLGCAHDSEGESGCVDKNVDNSSTIMAPNVVFFTHEWSNCSRDFVTHLFENKKGECLLDEPEDHSYALPDMPVGALYGPDDQCKFEFGKNYISANIGGEKFCEELWCKLAEGSDAVTKSEPVADGSKCGPNQWCFNRECVSAGSRPEAVNGNWGPWNSWNECSRSCGGGIRVKERLCNNPLPMHHGRYCLGKNKEYEICNIEKCDDSKSGFRDVQCAEFNKKPYMGILHTWSYFKPPDTDPNPCALYCVNEEKTFVKLAPRVKDGTRCHLGTRDTCIQGSCVHVGCDWKVHSKMVEDACGICGGDGTHCNITHDVFKMGGSAGYTEFLVVPSGATNIRVEEMHSSENMIAVSAADRKTYYLNSDYTETEPGKVRFGNVSGIYTKPEPEREEVIIKGPTKEPLVFYVVFLNAANPGYKYWFSVQTQKALYTPKYHWEFIIWDDCSARCAGGTQISKAMCTEERDGRVSDTFCNVNNKPEPRSRLCNMQACKTRWKVWRWGPCSGCIFKSGVRRRQVECVKENPNLEENDEIITKPEDCCGDPPKNFELCNSSKPCPKNINVKRSAVECNEVPKNSKRKRKRRFSKKTSLCDVLTGNSSTGIVQDPIAEDTICLKVAPINGSKGVNLSEQEEIDNTVPKEVITGPIQEFHSSDAIKKLEDIQNGNIDVNNSTNETKVIEIENRKSATAKHVNRSSVLSPSNNM